MKLLCLDVESNGLHGNSFAVGAVTIDETGTTLSRFEGRCKITGKADQWVSENVLPSLEEMPVNYKKESDLRQGFWSWFCDQRKDAVIVLDCGYPVEARFLLACQEDDIDSRAFDGPYPLHEIATLLLAAGVDPDINRESYASDLCAESGLGWEEDFGNFPRGKHHPLRDAWVSGLAALTALRSLCSHEWIDCEIRRGRQRSSAEPGGFEKVKGRICTKCGFKTES